MWPDPPPVSIDNQFEVDYNVEVAERPTNSSTELRFRRGRVVDGLSVKVCRKGKMLWRGLFSRGENGFSAIVAGPRPAKLVVVSGGAGYLVDVMRPSSWSSLLADMITGVVCLPAENIVVLYDPWRMTATDGERTLWTWEAGTDGFSDVNVVGNMIEGLAHFPGNGPTAFSFQGMTGPEGALSS